jgi:predicted amidohydrolase
LDNSLAVTLVQASLAWEDIDQNLSAFDAILESITEPTRLIVLPEMFTTGFSLDAPALAQTMDGSAVAWMVKRATEKGVDLVGSLLIRENGCLFNRLVWVCATGEIHWYDKRHLFRFAGEDRYFTPGTERLIVTIDGWKISPFVCYDLRFPCWTRNVNNGYDIALFVANWPASRRAHWRSLLVARAIENQAYVVGVNRVGTDGNAMVYKGDSTVIDPGGEVMFHHTPGPVTRTIILSHNLLQEYRRSFPFWMDADGFSLSAVKP